MWTDAGLVWLSDVIRSQNLRLNLIGPHGYVGRWRPVPGGSWTVARLAGGECHLTAEPVTFQLDGSGKVVGWALSFGSTELAVGSFAEPVTAAVGVDLIVTPTLQVG
jgi:hypothetical protein